MNQQRRHHRRRFVAAVLGAGVVAGTLATGSVAAQEEGSFVAEYADATFERRGTVLRLAPGEVNDQGAVTEVLEASVTDESCQGRFLVAVNLAATIEAADLEGVDVDTRGGAASVQGAFSLSGELTLTPAGRGCAEPDEESAVTTPLTTDVSISAVWSNARASQPVEYSGADCGGNGACYYRDARAQASWESGYLDRSQSRTSAGFFFEGVYPAT